MHPVEPRGEPARADLVVLGAGVVGLATAYAAARRGLSVLLLDRADGPVQGTSFANGAQLSYAYTDAMAGPSTWRQLPAMLFGRNGPFRTRWSTDPDFWRWGLAFLRQTGSARLRANTLATLQLALESRSALHALLQRHPIAFDHAVSGKLHVYHDAAALHGAASMIALKQPFGVEQHLLDARQAIAAEPALAAMPGDALALAQRALQLSAGNSFDDQLALEADLQRPAGAHPDYRAAVESFRRKVTTKPGS